jgi:hypothetical protein
MSVVLIFLPQTVILSRLFLLLRFWHTMAFFCVIYVFAAGSGNNQWSDGSWLSKSNSMR